MKYVLRKYSGDTNVVIGAFTQNGTMSIDLHTDAVYLVFPHRGFQIHERLSLYSSKQLICVYEVGQITNMYFKVDRQGTHDLFLVEAESEQVATTRVQEYYQNLADEELQYMFE